MACGAWVPSSVNLGPPPKNLITGLSRFCNGRKISNPPNWALALWTEKDSSRRARAALCAGEIFMSGLSWKDWCGHVRSDRMTTGAQKQPPQWRGDTDRAPAPPDRTGGEVKDCTDLGAQPANTSQHVRKAQSLSLSVVTSYSSFLTSRTTTATARVVNIK